MEDYDRFMDEHGHEDCAQMLARNSARSRYEELFGTPERAAGTLHRNGSLICRECLIRDECVKTPEDSDCMIPHYDALLEWLRGDA